MNNIGFKSDSGEITNVGFAEEIEDLTYEKELFKATIKTIAKIYSIDKSDMVSILTGVSQNLNKSKDQELER